MSTPTIITAEIRALRPITVAGRTFDRGDSYAQLRFVDPAMLAHFRSNLRFSAFEVVTIDERHVKARTMAGLAKVSESEVELALGLTEENAGLKAQIKALKAELRATTAAAAPAAESQPEPKRPATPEEIRTAAIVDLRRVDGIGPSFAQHLFDAYGLKDRAELAAFLPNPDHRAALLADATIAVGEKMVEHWERQVAVLIETTPPAADIAPADAPQS